MSTWASRIKERMKELGLTQEALANNLGITRGAITHYLSGRRVPPLRQFQKIATILKADPAWLQFGTTTKASTSNKKTMPQQTYHSIPILTWEQVAEYPNLSKLRSSAIKEVLPHFYTDQAHWYALRVKGDAMTSPQGQKSYYEGDTLIVDPDQPAKNGSLVIALLGRAKEATFKQYVIDGGIKYLKPLNPQYPLVEVNDRTVICGVVAGCLS